MTNQEIGKILTQVINEKYPGIDMGIYVMSGYNPLYITSANQLIYTIFLSVSSNDYTKYNNEGLDKPKLDKIRELIRDFFKMLGIQDKVKFQFWNRDEFSPIIDD